MPRELSPFELDRELAKVAPRARAAYRALRSGREVRLTIPEVLRDPETIERVATDKSDPIAAPLLRWLYWLELSHRALPLAGARVRQYRAERHALDKPLSGYFTWRELLGHALRDGARRPALLDVMLDRGGALRDAGARFYELRAELPTFAGRSRSDLEQPGGSVVVEAARALLTSSADAQQSLELRSLSDVLTQGLATDANDGWPRQLSLRTLNELMGSRDWLSGLRLDAAGLPAPLSAASFARGMLTLGAAWAESLAPASQPFSLSRDPFGLVRAQYGALFASLTTSPPFLRRQLGLGKERVVRHARALSRSALLFVRQLALRALLDEPALSGPGTLTEAFSELGTRTFGFEPPPRGAGLLFRPRLGDAQRFAGVLLAAEQTERLVQEHDEDWFRNPRAIEQLRAETRVPPAITTDKETLERGARALTTRLSELI
ncbi:MAG: Chromosome partition protein smc [Polyangiaceae bacterium]|nr:Chromosome partition protein smc [Polyangiaceae bacterium]